MRKFNILKRIFYIKQKYIIKIIIFLLFCLFLFSKANAQVFKEYEVKAAYIYSFTKFIDVWPSNNVYAEKKFVIGLYGGTKIKKELEKLLKNRKIRGKEWEIIYYPSISDFQNKKYKEPDIIFVSEIAKDKIYDLLFAVQEIYNESSKKKKSILTIGDNLDGFCESGGMINFTPKNSKRQFQINNEAVKNAGFKISSKLLHLSKIIENFPE